MYTFLSLSYLSYLIMKVHKPDLQAFLPHQVDQEGQEDPVCRREEALTLNAAKIQVCTPLRFRWCYCCMNVSSGLQC